MGDRAREKVELEEATLQKLRPILDVIRQINQGHDLRRISGQILQLLMDSCRAERGALVVFRKEGFKVELARHRSGLKLKKEERGISRTVLLAVQRTGRPVLCADACGEPQFGLVDSVLRLQLRSVLCVPLRNHDKVIGAIYLDDPTRGGAFGEQDAGIAEILAGHAAIAFENARLYKQSNQDRLTHLWNHTHFKKRLDKAIARARESNGHCGLIMIDIDDFKQINDQFGHEVGNQVLKHVAKTLATTVRSADVVARAPGPATVARFGGDEFEIVLPNTNRDGVRLVGQRLVAELGGQKFSHEGRKLRLSISVGGAVFPENASSAEALIVRADEALYLSKNAGKNRAAFAGGI